jgi:hypothetical protein
VHQGGFVLFRPKMPTLLNIQIFYQNIFFKKLKKGNWGKPLILLKNY